MTETKKNIYQKLTEARAEFAKGGFSKNGRNDFSGYNYFRLDEILVRATEINARIGICPVEYFTAENAILTLVNSEDKEDTVQFSVPMSTAKLKGCHEVQNLGAVISYLRRYLYQNAYAVCEAEMVDSGKYTPEEEPQKPKKPTLSEQAKKLSAFATWAKDQAAKNPEGVNDCLALYGFESIEAVTFDKIASVTHAIQELN